MSDTILISDLPLFRFTGSDYDKGRDQSRLQTQLECIESVVIDGQWRDITQLTAILRSIYPHVQFPENSVQAQLRNLRKTKQYIVEKRNVSEKGACWQYRVRKEAL